MKKYTINKLDQQLNFTNEQYKVENIIVESTIWYLYWENKNTVETQSGE